MTSRQSLAAVLTVVIVLLVGCGEDPEISATPGQTSGPELRPIQELSAVVKASKLELSTSSIEAAPVTVTVQNDGKGPYHLAFARLNEGVSLDEVEKKIQSEKVLELITVAGSVVEAAKPGETSAITIEFPEGDYIALDPETKVQFAQFSVTPASGDYETPVADYDVELGEFFFDIPKEIASGPVTFAVSNVGEQSHELALGLVKGGSDEGEGFMLAPAPGGTAWAEFDLKPGSYKAICYFPDPKSGKPHIKLGMKTAFVVN